MNTFLAIAGFPSGPSVETEKLNTNSQDSTKVSYGKDTSAKVSYWCVFHHSDVFRQTLVCVCICSLEMYRALIMVKG